MRYGRVAWAFYDRFLAVSALAVPFPSFRLHGLARVPFNSSRTRLYQRRQQLLLFDQRLFCFLFQIRLLFHSDGRRLSTFKHSYTPKPTAFFSSSYNQTHATFFSYCSMPLSFYGII